VKGVLGGWFALRLVAEETVCQSIGISIATLYIGVPGVGPFSSLTYVSVVTGDMGV
jgi:hypothetical protein